MTTKQETIEEVLGTNKEVELPREPIPLWPNKLVVGLNPNKKVEELIAKGKKIPYETIELSLYIGDIRDIDSDEIKIYTQLAWRKDKTAIYLITDKVPTSEQESLCYQTLAFYIYAGCESHYLKALSDDDVVINKLPVFIDNDLHEVSVHSINGTEFFISASNINMIGTQAFKASVGGLYLYAKGEITTDTGNKLQTILDNISEQYSAFIEEDHGQHVFIHGFELIDVEKRFSTTTQDDMTIMTQVFKTELGKYSCVLSIFILIDGVKRYFNCKSFLMEQSGMDEFIDTIDNRETGWSNSISDYTDITAYRIGLSFS
jgi:hypothetical protein